jgi:SSS family solute:Na+ symporter
MHELLSFSPIEGAGEASLTVLGLLGIQWIAQANADGTGYLAQRSMSCTDGHQARIAAIVFTYVQSVIRTLLWLPIVVGLLVLYPIDGSLTADGAIAAREATFIYGIRDQLPSGVLGLMLVGLFAALASTVDTHLNWGASYWTNDLYGRLLCARLRRTEPNPRVLVWVARLSNLLILALALVIMLHLGSIQSAWKTSLLLGAGIGVPLILRWLWHRQNAWGELVPIAVSLGLAPLLLHVLPDDSYDALRMLIMTLVATTSSILASLATAPVEGKRLRFFYLLVRPPGYWGAVALACGDEPRQVRRSLWRGLGATLTAAASVFALIIGAGSWLLHAPAPGWIGSRVLWIALCLGTGLLLVAVWWRLGMRASANERPPMSPAEARIVAERHETAVTS